MGVDLKELAARAMAVARALGDDVDAEQLRRAIERELGVMPMHEWDGTRLRFQQGPDGSRWGEWVDLRGPPGEAGAIGGVIVKETAAAFAVADMVLYDETGRAILTPSGQAILAIGQ
jgi:hypothetical protein